MEPKYFKNPAEWRKWLEKNHEKEAEILVGFYKTGTGRPSITWPESVDQALCFGWIDGVRRGIDEDSYTIRFTPRKASSIWSAVNIKKVEALTKQGLMRPAGIAAFERRKDHKSQVYSFEQNPEHLVLPPAFEKEFKQNKMAWTFFSGSAPSYRKAAIWWVISAKQEATRQKRFKELVADSAQGLRVKPLRR